MAINFFSKDINFFLKNKIILLRWVKKVLTVEKGHIGEINYIFCDDNYLHSLNKKHLHHDTYTDILTFDYSSEIKKHLEPEGFSSKPIPYSICGDIFISVPRLKENAKKFETSFEKELHRVMIHGILHLCGYGDKTKAEKQLMRKKEEESLKMLYKNQAKTS